MKPSPQQSSFFYPLLRVLSRTIQRMHHISIWFLAFLAAFFLILHAEALSQQLQDDPALQMENHEFKPLTGPSEPVDPWKSPSQGGEQPYAKQKKVVLKGGVKTKTLYDAIKDEGHVNWYAWYMRAREYLGATGGIDCPLGTPIKFFKSGAVQPLSQLPMCRMSLMGRHVPLPKNTELEAVILPTRSGVAPPASKQELMYYLRQSK